MLRPTYDAFVTREGKVTLAEFPDCPGCQTFAEKGDALPAIAQDALEGWLETHLLGGEVPPKPKARKRAPAGAKLASVPVRPGLWAALMIRWARSDAGISQRELAARAGVSQQQIAKLENPDENPTVGTLDKVARALGLVLNVGFEAAE